MADKVKRGRAAIMFTGLTASPAADTSAGWLVLSDAAPSAARAAVDMVARAENPCVQALVRGMVRVPLRAVVAEHGGVAVRSAPRWDPACGCTVTLTLVGRRTAASLASAGFPTARDGTDLGAHDRWGTALRLVTPAAAPA